MAQRISILVALEGADEGLKRAITSAERSLGELATTAKTAGDKAAAGMAEVKAGMSAFSEQVASAKTQLLAFLSINWAAGKVQEVIQIADAWAMMSARLKLATAGQQEFTTAQTRALRHRPADRGPDPGDRDSLREAPVGSADAGRRTEGCARHYREHLAGASPVRSVGHGGAVRPPAVRPGARLRGASRGGIQLRCREQPTAREGARGRAGCADWAPAEDGRRGTAHGGRGGQRPHVPEGQARHRVRATCRQTVEPILPAPSQRLRRMGKPGRCNRRASPQNSQRP